MFEIVLLAGAIIVREHSEDVSNVDLANMTIAATVGALLLRGGK
jgi:hypothetical protein